MAQVVTVISDSRALYYYEVSDAVGDAITLGQEDIEFETLDGYRVGIYTPNTLSIIVGATRYIKSSGDVPSP